MHFGAGAQTDHIRENAAMDFRLTVCKLHLFDDWSTEIIMVFSYARMTGGKNAGMDVCLDVGKLHLSDDSSADIRELFLLTCMIVVEYAGMESGNAFR